MDPSVEDDVYTKALIEGGFVGHRILLLADPATPPELKPTTAQVQAAQQLVTNAARARELIIFERRLLELEQRLEEALKELDLTP